MRGDVDKFNHQALKLNINIPDIFIIVAPMKDVEEGLTSGGLIRIKLDCSENAILALEPQKTTVARSD